MTMFQQKSMASDIRSWASSVVVLSKESMLKYRLVEFMDQMTRDFQLICAEAVTKPFSDLKLAGSPHVKERRG
jgi:hypothetical protein